MSNGINKMLTRRKLKEELPVKNKFHNMMVRLFDDLYEARRNYNNSLW